MTREVAREDRGIVYVDADGNKTLVSHTDGKINVNTIDSITEVTTAKIYGKTGTSTYQMPRIDAVTHTLQTINYTHYMIHAGDHFMYTDAIELNDGSSQVYLITTPDTTKWAHMLFDLQGSAITQFELYEGADRTGTTEQTIGNNNRNSDTESVLVLHKGVSAGSTDGTLMHIYKGGSATNQARDGSLTGNDEEIILKQNTKYILKVTSGTASNLINVKLEWYEYIDKEA